MIERRSEQADERQLGELVSLYMNLLLGTPTRGQYRSICLLDAEVHCRFLLLPRDRVVSDIISTSRTSR